MRPMPRPRIALSMMDGLLGYAFAPQHLERLAAGGGLVGRDPLRSFGDDPATAVLGEAQGPPRHWGGPALTAEVMDAAPGLRMFAYAAGRVKGQVPDAVWARDVLVTSAAAANAVPVAEYTVAMILLANKGVLLFREHQRDPSVHLPFDMTKLGN